jgi:hypothetical protein
MARPKGKPKRKAEGPGASPIAITIRGSLEWRGWVERGADHCRTDVAKLVDVALIRYLREQGFTDPPPKR